MCNCQSISTGDHEEKESFRAGNERFHSRQPEYLIKNTVGNQSVHREFSALSREERLQKGTDLSKDCFLQNMAEVSGTILGPKKRVPPSKIFRGTEESREKFSK